MFKSIRNSSVFESVQVCRLCLKEEEDLIHIFNTKGYQGFLLWEIIEELLQMEVSKKDGLPWTICEGCISKVTEFKHFKTTCIKSKISLLTMIANRGLVSNLVPSSPTWPLPETTEAFRKRLSSRTSRKDSDEVEGFVEEEIPVVSEDEDPLQSVTVVRREEDDGAKWVLAPGLPTPPSQEATKVIQKGPSSLVNWKDSDEVEVVETLKEESPVTSCHEDPLREVTVSRKERKRGHGGKVTLKDDVDGNESISDADTCGQEIHWKVGSACTGVFNDAALADPLAMTDKKEDAVAGESSSEAVTYNQIDLQENDTLDAGASTVVCLPIVMGKLCGAKEEDNSSESLAGEGALGVEDIAEDESRLTSVTSVISVPQPVGNVDTVKVKESVVDNQDDVHRRTLAFGSGDEGDGDLPVKSESEVHVKTRRDELDDEANEIESGTSDDENLGDNGNESDGDGIESKVTDVSLSDDEWVPDRKEASRLKRKNFEIGRGKRQSAEHRCESESKTSNKRRRFGPRTLLDGDSILNAVNNSDSSGTSRREAGVDTPERMDAEGKEMVRKRNAVAEGSSSAKGFRKEGEPEVADYKCSECGEVFSSRGLLANHEKDHFSKNSNKGRSERHRRKKNDADGILFQCEDCGEQLPSQGVLNAHIKKKHMFFVCDICNKVCKQKMNLNRHIRCVHLKNRDYLCGVCGKRFVSNQSLKMHIETVHEKVKAYKCDICWKEFSRKKNLNLHVQTIHVTDTKFSCKLCSRTFKRADYIKKHMRTHTGVRPYACEICPEKFRWASDLKRHMEHHSEKKHVCSICSKQFLDSSVLRKHLLVHSNERPHQCKECPKAFKIKHQLMRHMLIHSELKLHGCAVCGKYFSLRSNMVRHMRIHKGEKSFGCHICSMKFLVKASLQNHILTHSDEKRFQCEECGKWLKSKECLRNHSVLHTPAVTEKPFRCDTCSRSFLRKSNLRSHMSCHTGLKPYVCEVCAKAFSHMGNLNAHMDIHMVRKRFQCDKCDFTTVSKSYVKIHKRKTHEDELDGTDSGGTSSRAD